MQRGERRMQGRRGRACALGWVALLAALLSSCQRSVVRLGKDEPVLDVLPPIAGAPGGPPPAVTTAVTAAAGTAAAGSSAKQSSLGPNTDVGEAGSMSPRAGTGGAESSGGAGGKAIGGSRGAAGATAGSAAELPFPALLPARTYPCPELTGIGQYSFMHGLGYRATVQIYIAPDAADKAGPGGPLLLYWHATGTGGSDLDMAVPMTTRAQVLDAGGVVAALVDSVCSGSSDCTVSSGLGTWYDEDLLLADEVVACALEQAHIDPRRIHTLGFSAGAIQAMYMADVRSGYIASVVSFSGGGPRSSVLHTLQDPTNLVPALLTYGSLVQDVLITNFRMNSLNWYEDHAPLGQYGLMCDHGMGHHIPPDAARFALRFFTDHPYKIAPEPYLKGLPAEAPGYCSGSP